MKKMLVLKETLVNKKTPDEEKIKVAKLMALDPDGGNILVDLKAGYQLNDRIAKEGKEASLCKSS